MDASTEPSSELSLDQIVELERRAAASAAAADATGGDVGSGDDADDDTIVLPWWQHPLNIVTIVVTVMIAAALIGWMIGDSNGAVEHNDVDTGFLQDMRDHHEQAVLMGFIYRTRPDIDPGLSRIAAGIIQGQSMEVGRMVQLLRDFDEAEANETDTAMTWMGHSTPIDQMPGMATEEQLEALGAATGAEADQMFVDLMSAHHEGGIGMAEYAAQHGKNDEVVKMAAAMAASQRSEIAEMQGQLD